MGDIHIPGDEMRCPQCLERQKQMREMAVVVGVTKKQKEQMAKTKQAYLKSYEESARYLANRIGVLRPKILVYCGADLGPVISKGLEEPMNVSYAAIPNFPQCADPDHPGSLTFGKLNGKPVVIMNGRFHYYDGCPLKHITFPVKVLYLIGVEAMIVINSAGATNPEFHVGDFMIILDHVNLMGLVGNHPHIGANEEYFGDRHYHMDRAYDRDYITKAKEIAEEMGMDNIMQYGVYACISGPCYSTIAEIKMYYNMGIDAVGMSTAPEVCEAVHCGMTVFGLSVIVNKCKTSYAENDDIPPDEEVIRRHSGDHFDKLVEFFKKFIGELEIKAIKRKPITTCKCKTEPK